MMDPERLLKRGGTGLGQSLLRAGRSDAPSKASIRRAIGVAAAGAVTAGGSASAASALTFAAVGKWVAVVAIASVTATLAVSAARTPQNDAKEPHATAETVSVVGPPAGPSLVSPALPALPDLPALPAPSVAGPGPRRVSALSLAPAAAAPHARSGFVPSPQRHTEAATPKATPRVSLEAEMAMLEEARSAIAAGKTAQAEATLDAYTRAFATRHFEQEVTVMRIEALVASNQRGVASSLAERFLTEHPTSPMARRVRSMTGMAE